MAKTIKVIRPFTLSGVHQAAGSNITVDDAVARFHIGKGSASLSEPEPQYPSFQNVFSGPMSPAATAAARDALSLERSIELLADAALYVATNGNDTTGDGTQAKPFLTIQKACDTYARMHLNGFVVTVRLASGTYTLTQSVNVCTPRSYGGVRTPRLIFESVSGVNTDVVIQCSFNAAAFFLRESAVFKDITLRSSGGIGAHGVEFACHKAEGPTYMFKNVRASVSGAVVCADQDSSVSFWGMIITLFEQNPRSLIQSDFSRVGNGGSSITLSGVTYQVTKNNTLNGGVITEWS